MLLPVLLTVSLYGLSLGAQISNQQTILYSNENFEQLKRGIVEFFENDGKTDVNLEELADLYPLNGLFNHLITTTDIPPIHTCELCKIAVDMVIKLRVHWSKTNTQLTDLVSELCTLLKVETERVCKGSIKPNVEIITYIIDNKENISSSDICGILLQNDYCGSDAPSWDIPIPAHVSSENKELVNNATMAADFNILHISDIHYDPWYTYNGNKDCGEPLCCQPDQPEPESEAQSCGYWMEYSKTDPPMYTVREVLKQTNTHEFDLVYYTGDIISHRVWDTSVENNTRDIREIFKEFRTTYRVPVYPVLGNHESQPLNQFAPTDVTNQNVSTLWLLDLMFEEMSDWLPEDARLTIKKGAYYTVVPKPGFRVIALNTNVCYTQNWWLIYDAFDPYGQLQWLVDVLVQAETNNEKVHILMHVPSGDSNCFISWSSNYNKIVKRFASTISGQFTGHTHKDQFSVFYNSSESRQAIGVTFNGASITTYSNSNPSYKVYQVNSTNYGLLDYEEWTFDLPKANLDPEASIDWYKLYTFRQVYNVTSLEPSEIAKVVANMATNQTMLQMYNQYKYRMGDGIQWGCDDDCNRGNLCTIVTSDSSDNSQCTYIKELYDSNIKKL